MERFHKSHRACTVAAAAAHDLNDELTIIFSCVCDSISTLEPGHPARALLLDARSAVQRCAWKASGLLNYSAHQGVRPVPMPLEAILAVVTL